MKNKSTYENVKGVYENTPGWVLASVATLAATAMFGLPLTAVGLLAVGSYKLAEAKAKEKASEPIDITPKDGDNN